MDVPGPRLRYDIVDVFTDTPFTGNPLAVVHGADELPTESMQAMAREFNLSETAFCLPASEPEADYRLRIFTPTTELPFAGHPSIGAAWLLAKAGVIRAGAALQECGVGLREVVTDPDGARLTGGPPELGVTREPDSLADAAGLSDSDVDRSVPAGVAGCGINFVILPVWPDALARAVPNEAALSALGTELVLVALSGTTMRVRMFGHALGHGEDPATGSAALALGVWLVDRGLLPPDGESRYRIHQGAELGRPSILDCEVTAVAGAATRATVRGDVVAVAGGDIAVPT